MKKILLVFLLAMTVCSTSFAAIERKTDNFNGSVSIGSSSKNVASMEMVDFVKVYSGKSITPSYSLMAFKIDSEWWFFSRDNCQIKIDDTIYDLTVLQTDSNVLGRRSLLTTTMTSVSPTVIDALKTSKQVTVRFYSTNRPSITWDVPEYVLQEWKSVINAEK